MLISIRKPHLTKIYLNPQKSLESMPDVLKEQDCPICHQKTLDLMEGEIDIPFFGKTLIFSMNCSSCNFHKADIEAEEQKPPCKCSIEVSGEADMKIRVVRSSQATVKIPHIVTIEPGPGSNGYVTNIEGIIERVKHEIQTAANGEEDEETKKKARNMIKKLNRVVWGSEKLKISLEDPSGNSAIISDKTVVGKL
jgi:zinc finger protein